MRKYRSYSYDEYLRAMELLKDHGPTEVCRILGWPTTKKSLLHYWKYRKHKPPTARWRPEPSKELAYIIGVLYGDRCIKVHSHHYDIKLNTIDYEFADKFSRALAKLLTKNVVKPVWIGIQRGRNYGWEVTYSSKAFYIWYRKQTLETLKPYIEYNKDTVRLFLRGLYDSDGSNYRCKKIVLFNSNIELLYYVQYLLKKYFIIMIRGPYLNAKAGNISIKKNGEKIKTNRDNYSIVVFRRRYIQRFLNEIGFFITEKQLGLPRRK